MELRGEPQTREYGRGTIGLWVAVGIHVMIQLENTQQG